ncbi:MAG: citrate transporter [Treponema sp.]|nr:citrate transporter [Treponema sp.]
MILQFIKKEAVFFAAFTCALLSSFFVPPTQQYLTYIDWNTLCILFALMGVVGAFRACGLFEKAGVFLCGKVSSIRALSFVLIFLCFFSSMFITNDVALLTFIPLTIELLGGAGIPNIVMLTVILQTIAANTGSMLTPLGNPQNLFLFEKMGLPVFDFIKIILPYSILCFIGLCVCLVRIPAKKQIQPATARNTAGASRLKTVIYFCLFVLCLLAVVRLIPKWVCALCVLTVLSILDRKVLAHIDYMLLLTFMAFFIFTGNIAAITPIKSFLMNIVQGNEYTAAVISSQIISNVPATLLLYPFTSAGTQELLIGVNAGGLGTLVASLASLISFKIYAANREKRALPSGGRYLATFSVYNIVFLVFLTGLHILLHIAR